MLLNCNSCQKKFIVPDSAITQSGRLVQCGSCGNKWTQYPIKNIPSKKTNVEKKTKPKKNLYTAEYLKKKHGIVINETKTKTDNILKRHKGGKKSFGFYSYIVILLVFFFSLFGILNLTKEIIILQYPITEIYINYLYEVIDIIKISVTEFVNQFSE
ncbi:zinc-ribbon domain-containing protein [Pelagibacteraceae bacterium]|nr:zinc-ribbon domain-containing protein [Pelagibacteraceae bacterium]